MSTTKHSEAMSAEISEPTQTETIATILSEKATTEIPILRPDQNNVHLHIRAATTVRVHLEHQAEVVR